MKRLPVLIGVLVLLLLLILLLLFWPQKKTNNDGGNLAFPESNGTVTRTNQTTGITGSAGVSPVVNTNVVSVSGTVPRSNSASTPSPYVVPPLSFNSPSGTSGIFNFFNLNTNTNRGTNRYIPRIPLITAPVTSTFQPSRYSISTSTPGPRIIGHARNGDNITFDPLSGDLHVGEYHFNFGMGPMPNGATSDVVGDPENVALGTNIGIFIGSLLGDPGTGLLLGTVFGSNLASGYRLSDMGIGLENGLITLGGEDAISLLTGTDINGLLGNVGLDGIAGGAGGGGIGVFGGTLTLVSVCDVGTLYFIAGTPYSGELMWIEGISSEPPYLNAAGTPPLEGSAIGHYSGVAECIVGDVPVGGGPVMYGYGTAL